MKQQSWLDWGLKQASYKGDTYESAYFNILSKKDRYLSDIGREGFNTRLDPKTQSLYNAKVSMKVGDKELAQHYLEKYFKLGGTKEGFQASLQSMSPLAGMSKQELAGFIRTLNKDDKDRFKMSMIYYGTLITGPNEEK
jgi:hypothetical protein